MGKSGGDDPAAKDSVSTSFSEEKPGTPGAKQKDFCMLGQGG
jgi:hypothetical protein